MPEETNTHPEETTQQTTVEEPVSNGVTTGVDGPQAPVESTANPQYVPVAEGQTNQPEGQVVEPPADDSTGDGNEAQDANDGDN